MPGVQQAGVIDGKAVGLRRYIQGGEIFFVIAVCYADDFLCRQTKILHVFLYEAGFYGKAAIRLMQ